MSGVDEFLFNLVILGSVVNSDGVVWQFRGSQYYVIECMPLILSVSLHTQPTCKSCLTVLASASRYFNKPEISKIGLVLLLLRCFFS